MDMYYGVFRGPNDLTVKTKILRSIKRYNYTTKVETSHDNHHSVKWFDAIGGAMRAFLIGVNHGSAGSVPVGFPVGIA